MSPPLQGVQVRGAADWWRGADGGGAATDAASAVLEAAGGAGARAGGPPLLRRDERQRAGPPRRGPPPLAVSVSWRACAFLCLRQGFCVLFCGPQLVVSNPNFPSTIFLKLEPCWNVFFLALWTAPQ